MALRATLVVGLFVLVGGFAALTHVAPCSSVVGCYRFMRLVQAGQTPADDRRHVLMMHFAASPATVAFSTSIGDRSVGLVIFDRRTSTPQLISENGYHFGNPYFSSDGQRLLMVRSNLDVPDRELLSCWIATWHCTVLLKTEDSVMSPVEVDPQTILYARSPVYIRDGRRRYVQYDLYLQAKGAAAVRLTDFRLYELGFLSVTDNRIVFGAGAANNVLPKPELGQTEIYALEFDQQRQVRVPPLPLQPVFKMSTLSIRPSVSADGAHIAFLNVETMQSRYRYNLAVTTPEGSVQHYIKLTGIAFSRGAFVGDTMVFNEVFEDRYQVRQLDLKQGTITDIVSLDHTGQALEKLDRIKLRIEGDVAGIHAMR
jgi:hypothetical protein